LPACLLARVSEQPGAVALRVKELGRWREISWSEYAMRVGRVARGLRTIGVGRGDRVAIQSDNRPEWLVVDLAVQALGAATVAVYPTSPESELEHVVCSARPKVLVVEDQEQLDKGLAVRTREPSVERIVVLDTRGTGWLDLASVMSFAELEASAGPEDEATGRWFADAIDRLDPAAVATIVFTAGTTGLPRGVMLSHAALVSAARILTVEWGARRSDEVLSYLPLAQMTERVLSVSGAVVAGYVVNFGEGGESFPNDLREVQPTLFLAVPRVWEKLRATTERRLEGAGWLKQWCVHRFRAGLDRVPSPLGALLLTRPARRQLGFGRVRVTLATAAPMDTHVLEFFAGFGLRIREGYGLTEAGGLGTWTPTDAIRPGRVGRAPAPVELRVAADGEILVRGPSDFVGYLDDEAATRAVVDAAGWIRSGDLGELDGDGWLALTGRTTGVVITSAGTQVSPEHLERRLQQSPYVRDAVVVGDRRPWLSALIGIEPETTGEWAARGGLPVLGYHDLSERPEVRDLIADVIERVNQDLADDERIATFVLLPERLEESSGLLTATHRVRRAAVVQRFAATIDRMYKEGDR
jgi:long-chain acyl-CoA synthetase